MEISFGIKVTDPTSVIKQSIEREFYRLLNLKLTKCKDFVKGSVQNNIRYAIEHSPEYDAIIINQADIRAELGIPNPKEDLDYLIQRLVSRVEVTVDRDTLNVILLHDSYAEEMTNDPRFIITELTKTPLPWLKWLLLTGDDLQIIGYRVKLADEAGLDQYPSKISRTGLAIMVKTKTGDFFRMPPEFGPYRVDNNFVTRSIMTLENKFNEIIKYALDNF